MKEWKKIRSGLKWKNIFVLTLAGCINAFGVTIFLMPVKLYDSGISGTSMLLSQITPSWLSLPVFLIFLNIPLTALSTAVTRTEKLLWSFPISSGKTSSRVLVLPLLPGCT